MKRMTRRWGALAFAAAAWLLFSGMGDMGGDSTVLPPDPVENYDARLTDQSDVSVELTRFSFNGVTFINGKMGRADVSVDFENIQEAFFLNAGDGIAAKIHLKNGDMLELRVKRGDQFMGAASFGNFRIRVEDIQSVSFERR